MRSKFELNEIVVYSECPQNNYATVSGISYDSQEFAIMSGPVLVPDSS